MYPQNAANLHIDEFHVASVDSIPISDMSVDIVIGSWVLEHFEDPDKAMLEIQRVLKPGGHFVFWTPNKYNPAVMVSAMASLRLHRVIMRLLSRDAEWDNCHTYYHLH